MYITVKFIELQDYIYKIVQIFQPWVRVLIMRGQDTTVNFYQSRSLKSPSVCSLHWHKWNPSFSCSTEKSRKSAFSSLGWGKQSRAHIVGRHVTVCQLLSHRGSMSTTHCSAGRGQSAKAAGPPIGGRGLGALAGQALFTPAAGPGVFAASITLPPGRQGGNFCTSQNRIRPPKFAKV